VKSREQVMIVDPRRTPPRHPPNRRIRSPRTPDRNRRALSGGTLPAIAPFVIAVLAGACGAPAPEPAEGEALVLQVLPFEVQGQEEGADYVGWAVAVSLSNDLARSEDLRLLSVPEDGEPSAARGANRAIAGTLVRGADATEARLRMLDPTDDRVLWETRVSGRGTYLMQLVSRMARQTIRALDASDPEVYRYIGNVTGGPEMSETMLAEQALDTWLAGDLKGFLQASSSLVAQFGDDPAAHAIDAWALMISWDAAPLTETRLTRLRERLVELDRVDPASPYDEIIQAYVYRSSGQPDEARTLYTRVLAQDDLSSAARAWVLRQRSFTFLQTGNGAAARRDAERAVELDPSNAPSHVALSKALEAVGDLDGAVLSSKRALDLQPSSWRQHQRLSLVLIRGGKFDEATPPVDRACQLSEAQEPCANLAVALQRAGREAEARRAGEYAESLPASRWGYYNLACYQALAGRKSAALASLRRSVDLGFADNLITTDPDLDSLRDDAEFRSILSVVEERLRSRQRLSTSVFPWQA
jgi:tetratricopeptide (TPR) repeat protein